MSQMKILTSVVLLMAMHHFYGSWEAPSFYSTAMGTLLEILAEERNLSAHHFQPCPRHCGFTLAIETDPQYCIKSDSYKLLHPASVLEDVVVFRDYDNKDLARQLIRQSWYDAIPSLHQNQNLSATYKLPLDTSVVYPYSKNYFRTHRLGSMAGCLFQKYGHVPGQEEIALKSSQSIHFQNYLEKLRKQQKSEWCIDDAKYQKHTFKLWVPSQCRELFSILDTPEYQERLQREGIQYIFKTNEHLGKGVMVLDQKSEQELRQWYSNGCDKNRTGSIVQEYVTNTYLYHGYKMEFRVYFVIASTNPTILYAYKIALIKQCALPFDLTDPTKQGHICNTAVTKKHNEAGHKNSSKPSPSQDDDDDHYIDWNLEELQDLLLADGRISSTSWLDEYLRPQIHRKVTHMYLSVKDLLFKDSRVGELFGVDFIMDDDLRLWILECNRNPNFLAVTEGRMNKFSGLITEITMLQQAYIRSKYVRIKRFIETMQVNPQLKDEFMSLQEDYLEEQFQLPPSSNLEMIYVDSKNDTRYQYKHYLPEECLLEQ